LHSCIWELFFSWLLVVLFCWWCRALLPHIEEFAILEHFISVVSSRSPCLRGPRYFSIKWSFFGFCLAFDHLFEFFVRFFSFYFSLNWLLVCVVNALIKGEIEDRSVRGPVDGRSWQWRVIDNVVWTDSWPSIAGAGCCLICVGAGEEWARKAYALRGLIAVERQIGLTRGTRWPAGSSAGRMVARKARRSHRSELVQDSGSQPKSSLKVCYGSPQNRSVCFRHKTKTGGSAGGDRIRARREASKQRTRVGIARLVSRLREGPSPGIRLMVLQRHIPKVPLVGVYPSLGFRGILVFRLSPYILKGERTTAIIWFSYFPFLFSLEFP
jgi:hypothetical protein